VRQYQSNETSSAVTDTYVTSWILEPTELTGNNWSVGITSGSQTTYVKVKYRSRGQIFVQARTSHAPAAINTLRRIHRNPQLHWTNPTNQPIVNQWQNRWPSLVIINNSNRKTRDRKLQLKKLPPGRFHQKLHLRSSRSRVTMKIWNLVRVLVQWARQLLILAALAKLNILLVLIVLIVNKYYCESLVTPS
jgi:hypothetical protein